MVRRNDGHYISKLISTSLCQSDDGDVDLPCSTLMKFETTVNVTWEGEPLVRIVDTTEAARRIKFETISLQIGPYLDNVKAEVEKRMPRGEIMNTLSKLDQSKWPLHVRELLNDEEFLTQFGKWPSLFRLGYTKDEMVESFRKVVTFLETNTDFWCGSHKSMPTAFWSQLLAKFTDMPENLATLIGKSIVIPQTTSDVERYVSSCPSYYVPALMLPHSYAPLLLRSLALTCLRSYALSL